MGLNVTGAGLVLTALLGAWNPASAQVSTPDVAASQAASPAPIEKQGIPSVPTFVPGNFRVPVLAKAEGFKLVPLGPDLAKTDLTAYMSSIDHLQKTFSRSTAWPHAGITDAEAMQDMTNEQARFKNRKSFAYAVLTPDGRRERGCVYVSPSPVEGYDATVRMWVTQDEYNAGFDAKLYAWVNAWMKKEWPFAKVVYPGRSIDWGTWDSLVAASKARKAGSDKQKL
jgi:hypothetical protein